MEGQQLYFKIITGLRKNHFHHQWHGELNQRLQIKLQEPKNRV
jgi:hypothetical protein